MQIQVQYVFINDGTVSQIQAVSPLTGPLQSPCKKPLSLKVMMMKITIIIISHHKMSLLSDPFNTGGTSSLSPNKQKLPSYSTSASETTSSTSSTCKSTCSPYHPQFHRRCCSFFLPSQPLWLVLTKTRI